MKKIVFFGQKNSFFYDENLKWQISDLFWLQRNQNRRYIPFYKAPIQDVLSFRNNKNNKKIKKYNKKFFYFSKYI